MNKEAIELIEQKKRFCENMIEIETNYENQVYKNMVKENRIFEYILKILKENENTNLKQALNEIREYMLKRLDLGPAPELDYYAIRQDILQIIDKYMKED